MNISTAEVVAIADAVVQVIDDQSQEISYDLRCRRGYIPTYKLEDMQCLHITVVPRTRTTEIYGRKTSDAAGSFRQRDIDIAIGIQKRLKSICNDEIDPLTGLTEWIGNLFECKTLSVFSATCIQVRNDPVYDWDHLQQFQQFSSLLVLTYRFLVRV